MNYSLIVACDKNFLIGKDNKLPWQSKEDMAWFIRKTRHKAILMGSKTANDIGRVLPHRLNIVLTSKEENVTYENPVVVTSTAMAQFQANNYGFNEIVICGGLTLYRQYIDQVEKIYFTQLEQEYEGNVTLDIPLFQDLAKINDFETTFQGWALEELLPMPGVGVFKTFIKVNTAGAHR